MDLPEWEAENRIMAFNGQCRRPLRHAEVKRAIERAYSTKLPDSPQYAKPERKEWTPSNTRRSTYRKGTKGADECELWESSPIRCDDGLTQKIILNQLYPDPSKLVCVGKSAFEFHTARIDQFKDLSKTQFIVPCYMTKRIGMTQDGKPSMHCLDNCGDRLYSVCDFDEPKSEDHPSIIIQLKRVFDLVMVLSSGGKSLHAWFNIDPDEQDDFWDMAVPMGADIALQRNRSSFVRIPMGTRDNGRTQRVIYFNQEKCVIGS